MSEDPLLRLIARWRGDPGGSYLTWFLWVERLKNFRSIRRGIQQVVAEIEADSFGTQYRGSSLETVVGSIAEQRQIFKGADHAFLWKPKLRIPDIYESRENQLAFGRFLDICAYCSGADAVLDADEARVLRVPDSGIETGRREHAGLLGLVEHGPGPGKEMNPAAISPPLGKCRGLKCGSPFHPRRVSHR